MRQIIKNASVVGLDGIAPDQAVVIDAGKVVDVCPSRQLGQTAAEETTDAAGRYVAAGFIDLHIHGTHTFRVDDSPQDLAEMCRVLPRYGVTGCLPTVIPRPRGEDAAYVASLAEIRSEGAEILGLHLEGPFLALTGAIPPDALGRASQRAVRRGRPWMR